MKIRTKIILAFLAIIIPIAIIGSYTVIDLNRLSSNLNTTISGEFSSIGKTAYLNSIAQFIRYYDEVLTQSARNFAFTGNPAWKTRYEENSILLEKSIKEAISNGDELDKKIFSDVEVSNLALVELEQEAIALVENGNKTAAQAILDGTEYSKQKKIYQNALVQYSVNQGKKYNDTFALSSSTSNDALVRIQNGIRVGRLWTLAAFAIAIAVAIIVGLFTATSVTKPIRSLIETTKKIISGDFQSRVEISSTDETKELSENFNTMLDKLNESQQDIEQKVVKRTEELEKLNKFMVGREIKMMELKNEIETLKTFKNTTNSKSNV